MNEPRNPAFFTHASSRANVLAAQVMTGESWSEAVARPLVFGYGRNAATASIYFVSFIIVTQVIARNDDSTSFSALSCMLCLTLRPAASIFARWF